MKKLISLFLTLCMVMTLAVSVVACTPEPEEHVHDEQKFWSKDSTYHWKECRDTDCKEILSKAEHEWGESQVITNPTPNAVGKSEHTCTICQYKASYDVVYVPDPTITSENWDKALLITENHIISLDLSVAVSGIDQKYVQTIVVNGDCIAVNDEIYYEKDGENFYKYMVEKTELGGGFYSAKTYRQSTTENQMLAVKNIAAFLIGYYSSFTFDESTGAYVCAELTVANVVFHNVSLTFEDNKLVRFYCERSIPDQGVYKYDYSYSYETRTIEIPNRNNYIDLDNQEGGEGGGENQEGGEGNQ